VRAGPTNVDCSDDAELVELGQLQLVRVAWKDNGKG